ncbi:hypothetical protein [Candidatus Allofournierella excrementavium]|uniref:hypothetical protein n=1 Tax=Candidatus Allofournierella excrementavium TaxID=2838591 RepID=UPI003AB6C3CC
MEPVLTKDAEKMIVAAYQVYLERRKTGMDKLSARYFSAGILKEKHFKNFSMRDYTETVREMCRAFGCKPYTHGGFMLSDEALYYMENRFKNGVADTLSFLSQFIP